LNHALVVDVHLGAGRRDDLADDLAAGAYVSAEYRYSVYDGELSRHQGVAGLGLRF